MPTKFEPPRLEPVVDILGFKVLVGEWLPEDQAILAVLGSLGNPEIILIKNIGSPE